MELNFKNREGVVSIFKETDNDMISSSMGDFTPFEMQCLTFFLFLVNQKTEEDEKNCQRLMHFCSIAQKMRLTNELVRFVDDFLKKRTA